MKIAEPFGTILEDWKKLIGMKVEPGEEVKTFERRIAEMLGVVEGIIQDSEYIANNSSHDEYQPRAARIHEEAGYLKDLLKEEL